MKIIVHWLMKNKPGVGTLIYDGSVENMGATVERAIKLSEGETEQGRNRVYPFSQN